MDGFFDDDELVYAAHARCQCGAGLAYVPSRCDKDAVPPMFYWDCGDILTGRAIQQGQDGAVMHSDKYPFAFYEIKSETQPSQGGATTRPNGLVYHVGCGEPAWKCRCETQRGDREVRYK